MTEEICIQKQYRMKSLPNKPFFDEIEEIISRGNTVTLKVKGGSMRPYLRNEKDIVVLSPFRPVNLKQGAIVLFRYHNKHLLHRIIEIENDTLIIQGDGVYRGYEKALRSDVIGIVHYIIRPDGKPVSTGNYFSLVYWRCWRFLRPLRRYLLGVYDLMERG
jgi:signal peptidase I